MFFVQHLKIISEFLLIVEKHLLYCIQLAIIFSSKRSIGTGFEYRYP